MIRCVVFSSKIFYKAILHFSLNNCYCGKHVFMNFCIGSWDNYPYNFWVFWSYIFFLFWHNTVSVFVYYLWTPDNSDSGGGGCYWFWRTYHRKSSLLVVQWVKNLPAMQETWVPSLGWEDPREKEMATHPSILTWEISWTEEPVWLQSMGSQELYVT